MKAATGERGDGRGAGRRRRPHAALGRRRPSRRRRRARARDRAHDRLAPEHGQDPPGRPRRSRGAALPRRGDLRRPARRSPRAVRRPRDHRADSWTARASTSSRPATGRRSSPASRGSRASSVGDRRQQRRPLLGIGPQGDALHRDVRSRGGSRSLFLQNITGFMVGKAVRARGDRQGRREDGPCGRQRRGPEADGHRRRLVRRRQLRDVRPRVRAALPLDAGRTRGSRSWAASRRRPCSRRSSDEQLARGGKAPR